MGLKPLPGPFSSIFDSRDQKSWLRHIATKDYKARFYDPTIKRFLNADPIGYGDGLNMYSYVGDDPVNRRDPSGLSADDDEIITTGVRIGMLVDWELLQQLRSIYGDNDGLIYPVGVFDHLIEGGGENATSDDENEENCGKLITAPNGDVYTLPPGYTSVPIGGAGPDAGHHYMASPDGNLVYTPYYAARAFENYDVMMDSLAGLGAGISVGDFSGSVIGGVVGASSGSAILGGYLGGLGALPGLILALLANTPPPPDSLRPSSVTPCTPKN
ncbi:RHS repeat-associated protein [Litorimonas taeanensis]|uniref:RHS repeat-associated protein n=1 Tax=Litorimonas taeanensis TaxID=568099 RepID=A0A420WLV5_9PROT|nr:RHS repeat-associated core domain-containing protein [Litorimonas taeanensis]RKQ71865.1 RHS repeat-associated protein [Litorimonas taeanensis]